MTKLWDRLEANELAIGTITVANSGPEWVEILGNCGLDFHVSDMMITSVTWEQAANAVRAALLHEMTPVMRLQGFPWNGHFDARTISDVLRGLSIGAEVIMMSIETADEVRAVLRPESNWHRKVYLYKQDLDDEALAKRIEDLHARTLVVPHIESAGAAANLSEILQIEELRAIWLGMGDMSRALGHPGDPTHPEMRDFVKSTVNEASQHDVMVMANIGYFDSPEDVRDATLWLWEAGVKAVWITYPEYLIQRFYLTTMDLIRQETGSPRI